MRKRILTTILALVLVLSFSLCFADDDVKLFINGRYVESEEATTKPFLKDGRTFVPIRLVSETLGIEVKWDGATSTVTLIEDSNKISFKIGSDTALKNSKTKIKMASPATTIGGRTYVPLRFVAEAFGREVDWNDEHRTVIIGGGFEAPKVNTKPDSSSATVKKIDSKKDYVYIGDYAKNAKRKTYSVDGYASNLKIEAPFINIDSSDAKAINARIKKYTDQVIADFEKNYKDENIDDINVEYETFQYDNILSVNVYRSDSFIIVPGKSNISFMIDLSTGKQISAEEAAKIVGFKNITEFTNYLYGTVEKNIVETYDYIEDSVKLTDFDREKFQNNDMVLSMFAATESLDKGNLYINDDGEICVLMNMYNLSAGAGLSPQTVEVSKEYLYKPVANPMFKALNITADKSIAVNFVNYEYVDSKDTMGNIDIVYKIMTKYNIPLKDISFVATRNDEGTTSGSELYFIAAKYKNAPIRFVRASEDPADHETNMLFTETALGYAALRCNMSELHADTIIQVIIDGKIHSYSPSVSLKDTSVFVPNDNKNVIDITNKVKEGIKTIKPKNLEDLNMKYFDGIFPDSKG